MKTLARLATVSLLGAMLAHQSPPTARADECSYEFKIDAAKEVIGPAIIELYEHAEEKEGRAVVSGLVERITPRIRSSAGLLISGNYAIALEDVDETESSAGKVTTRNLSPGAAVRFVLPRHAEGIRFAHSERYTADIRATLKDHILTYNEVQFLQASLSHTSLTRKSQ